MTNRNTPPQIQSPGQLPLLSFRQQSLPNGLQIYAPESTEEFFRISFEFSCGTFYEEYKGSAIAFGELLLSGTSRYSAFEIQERLDQYGAYTDIDTGYEYLTVHVFCLPHFLLEISSFLMEVWSDIQIPESEFELYRQRQLEDLKIQEQKTGFLARRAFNSAYFGSTHPYGKVMLSEDYENLKVEQVREFAGKQFRNSLSAVYSNSALPETVTSLFRGLDSRPMFHVEIPTGNHPPTGLIEVQKDGAVQASLYLGLPGIRRDAEAYPAWSVLITLFGGFFGSRLMKTIREEKGYTYGISASNRHLPDRSLMLIRSDVKNDVRQECIDAIRAEMTALQETAVSSGELLTAVNYMLGRLQRGFDGSIALTDRYMDLIHYSLAPEYFQNYASSIRSVTPKELQKMAQACLKPLDLFIAVAGNNIPAGG